MSEDLMWGAVGAVIGATLMAVGTLGASYFDKKWKDAEKDIRTLCNQVEAYYLLEAHYLDALVPIDARGRARVTIQVEMRNMVKDATNDRIRPDMTALSAASIRRRWE